MGKQWPQDRAAPTVWGNGSIAGVVRAKACAGQLRRDGIEEQVCLPAIGLRLSIGFICARRI